MKNQSKTSKYKNKNTLTNNLDEKLNGILDQFLIKSEMDQSTTNKILKDTKLHNIESEIFDLTDSGTIDLIQHKSNQSSVKSANAQNKHTIIEMVDSDLEITYSGKTKSDTSNDSLSAKRKKNKKKKHSDAVPEKPIKDKKDRSVKHDLNLTDKEDNELFFFDLSGNKINNTLTEMTYPGTSKTDTSIIKKSKKKKRKIIEDSATIPAIKKKKDGHLFNDSQFSNKEDNELFFFDLSGSKTNSNLPQMSTQNSAKHTHFADEDIEITYSGIDCEQNESKLVKKKKHKQKELDQVKKKEKNKMKAKHEIDLISFIKDDTPKKRKDQNPHSDKEDCSQVLFPPKKKKKKMKSEPKEADGLDILTTNCSDLNMEAPKEKKKKKKSKLEPEVENTQTELNFSDCNSEIPKRKKKNKKVKSARIQVEHMEQAIDFVTNIFTDYKSIPSEKKKTNTQNSDLLSQSDDGTHLLNTAAKRKKKSKIKSEEITSNQNENAKLKSKIEENENEYGINYKTFEEYLNMDQEEDYSFHISSQIPPESVKSANETEIAVNSSFNKKKKKTVDIPENVNNSQNKTEMVVCKRDRTISEESFNTIIDSIVGDSTKDEENSFNTSLNEEKLKNKHQNYTSSDFNFDTILDSLISNIDAKDDSNNGIEKLDVKKKSKYQECASIYPNLDEIIEETEQEPHVRKKKKKKKKRKTSDVKQEQIEELIEEHESYDTHVSLIEDSNISQNSDCNTPKKSKKKKDKSLSAIEYRSDDLITNQIEELFVKKKSKGSQEFIEDLTEENNRSQEIDSSISKKSMKKSKHEECASIDPNSVEIIEETEQEPHVRKKKKKTSDVKQEQIEELIEENEAYDTHVSLIEDSSLSQNSVSNTPKKSKKKKDKTLSAIEHSSDALINNQIEELFIKKKSKGSQEDLTEENQRNSANNLDCSQDSVSSISKKSKKQKYSSIDPICIEEPEKLRVKKRKTGDVKQDQIEESEAYDTHVSLDEIPKKSKKNKTPHNSSIEKIGSGLRDSREIVVNSPNETHLSLSEALNLSKNSPKKHKKKKNPHNSAIEETTESGLQDSPETVINNPNETHLSLNQVLNLTQNSDGNARKKSKKKKTHNSSIEDIESGLRNNQEIEINSPNETHLSLKEVLNLSQNSDSIISNESKKKTREESIQHSLKDTNNGLWPDIFASSEEESLENIQKCLENYHSMISKQISIVNEENKQDSGFEDSYINAKTKKKTVRQSNEAKKIHSDVETNQMVLETTINTDNEDTGGEKTLKRKKSGDGDEEKQTINKKLKLDRVNESVNVDKFSESDKWNVEEVFSDDDEEESSKKIEKRVFKMRRNSSYVSASDAVIQAKKIKRTRSLSERKDSDSDTTLNITGVDIQELTDEELEILRTLNVHLPFHNRIPPLHMIQRPSRPTVQDMANARKTNAKFGPFTKEEDAQIVKNWKRFCKIHNLNVRPVVFFKFRRQWNTNDKIRFLQFLSHKLDDRMPFRVHARFKKIFESEGLKKGRYSFEEDKMIIDYINETNSSKPFYDLGIILNRPYNSVERRYAFLTSGENKAPVRWTTYMSERMVKAMMEVVETDNVKDLEHYVFKDAEWKKLSEILDNISPKRLQRAWNVTVHSRLFMKGTKQDVKKRLVQMMIDNGEYDYRAISWKNYAKQFQGITTRKLNDIFRLMIAPVPKELKKDLKGTLQHLSSNLDKLDCSYTQFRYRLKDGALVCKKRKETIKK